MAFKAHFYEKSEDYEEKEYFLELLENADGCSCPRVEFGFEFYGDEELCFVVGSAEIPEALVGVLLEQKFFVYLGLLVWGLIHEG